MQQEEEKKYMSKYSANRIIDTNKSSKIRKKMKYNLKNCYKSLT